MSIRRFTEVEAYQHADDRGPDTKPAQAFVGPGS